MYQRLAMHLEERERIKKKLCVNNGQKYVSISIKVFILKLPLEIKSYLTPLVCAEQEKPRVNVKLKCGNHPNLFRFFCYKLKLFVNACHCYLKNKVLI